MIRKVKYKPVFNRKGKLGRDGKASISIECYQNRARCYESMSLRLSPSEWDRQKHEVKKRPDLNRLIRDKINELEKFELTFSAHYGRAFCLSDFSLMKVTEVPLKEPATFSDFVLGLIDLDHEKKEINHTTQKRYKRVISLLAQSLDVKTIKFSDLTFSTIESFDDFLIVDQEQARNTVYKHHQVINKYLKRAINKNAFELKNNPYNDFKNRQKSTETIVLSPAEISKIENLTFTSANQHLEFYRDVFLFAYYTLLRIGDVTSLRKSNIIETEEGLVLDMSAQKTKKINRQKIFAMHPTPIGGSKPEKILCKYWRTDNAQFFKRSHPNLNEYIKDVVRLAGIEKNVTFHTSRHSGITTLVAMGVPVPIVQQLAQHKSFVTTMRYVHIVQQDVYQALSRANWNQDGKFFETKV